MLHSRSFMDPPDSACTHSTERMGRLLAEHLKIFTIETTLNNDTFPSQLGFLNKREWEWSLKDQAMLLAAKRANDALRRRGVRREFFHRIAAPYGVTGVTAGETEAVHERTLANLHRQQLIEVQRPVRRPGRRPAVHLPVQRELDHEPDPGAVPGARLLLQPVPRTSRSCGRAA